MPKGPYKQVTGDQNFNSAGAEIQTLTSLAATAGGNGALPATVLGYIVMELANGTAIKVPYYAN